MPDNKPAAVKPPETKHSSAKMAYTALIGIILIIGVFLLGYSLGSKQVKQQSDVSFAAGVESAKMKLQQAGILPPAAVIKDLDGTVTAVGSDSFEMDTAVAAANPLEEAPPAHRVVQIDPNTKLFKVTAKTAEQQAQDMKDFTAARDQFEKDARAGKTTKPPTPPDMTVSAPIKLSDLKKGDRVTVAAAADIASAGSFTATEVHVQNETAALMNQSTGMPASPEGVVLPTTHTTAP